MTKKYLIALFFWGAFSIQVLPIKQIGAMLFGNQVNEEAPQAADDGKGDASVADFFKHDPFLLYENAYTCHFLPRSYKYLHFSAAIPACHTTEINTPPPDAAA